MAMKTSVVLALLVAMTLGPVPPAPAEVGGWFPSGAGLFLVRAPGGAIEPLVN